MNNEFDVAENGEWGVEARRLAIEIIANLVNVKHTMAELVLKPARVPPEIYNPLIYKRDPATGRALSKRQIAPLILDAIDRRGDPSVVLRSMIEIAANWSDFHLADDEYVARATVQKAREFLGTIETMEAREARERELAREEKRRRIESEQASLLRRQSSLLLLMFDEMAKLQDHQRRGYLLQELLNGTLDLHEIPVARSFTRNEGGEQIDGAFRLEGWHYLVECRWRGKLADIRDLDGLKGQIGRSGKQTMGLFFSIEGWSDNVPKLLKQNPDKSIILMEGYDFRTTLAEALDLRDFILKKLEKLNLEGEPFLGVREYLAARQSKA